MLYLSSLTDAEWELLEPLVLEHIPSRKRTRPLTLKRSDFGIQGYSPYTDQVGDDIKVALFLEAIKLNNNGRLWELPKVQTQPNVNSSLTK